MNPDTLTFVEIPGDEPTWSRTAAVDDTADILLPAELCGPAVVVRARLKASAERWINVSIEGRGHDFAPAAFLIETFPACAADLRAIVDAIRRTLGDLAH